MEKKSGEWTISRKMTRKKGQEAKAEKTRGEKGKSNDGSEIPDRKGT